MKCKQCKYFPCDNIGNEKKCKNFKKKDTYNLKSFEYSLYGGANDKRRFIQVQKYRDGNKEF